MNGLRRYSKYLCSKILFRHKNKILAYATKLMVLATPKMKEVESVS